MSRKACEKIAYELFLLEHPDAVDTPHQTAWMAFRSDYLERVYQFDQALSRCSYTLVQGA
jgi:hypothetical protein